MRRLLTVPVLVVAAAAYRHWHLTWGATPAEVAGPMPGDDLLPTAAFTATRAIDVAAPPELVWPWIVQVGFRRAGFYSYDHLDNVGEHSADQILPQFQHVRVGDVAAPMADPATDRTSFRVAQVAAPHTLVWAKPDLREPDSTWAWWLTDTPGGGTRLVTRLKVAYRPAPALPFTVVLMELGDFPMMRRMLLGLCSRAEALARAELHPRAT
jgi:hypothetical protein